MPDCELSVELAEGEKLRLDRYVALSGTLTRSQLKSRNAVALVNGAAAKLSTPVKSGDCIGLCWEDEPAGGLVSEQIPLDILYEDDRVIVVNKPGGMVTHPAAGNWSGTLVNALLGYQENRGGSVPASGSIRPFIAHRLDKDTSGVLIAAWDAGALEFLQAQFRLRTVRKTYLALCRGVPRERQGTIDAFLARDPKNRKRFAASAARGKPSLTRYRLLSSFARNGTRYTLFDLRPKTGRTHQLRVHLKHIGCPIVGDSIYTAADKNFPGVPLMLHARRLVIQLPGRMTPSSFFAPLPFHLRDILQSLGSDSKARF